MFVEGAAWRGAGRDGDMEKSIHDVLHECSETVVCLLNKGPHPTFCSTFQSVAQDKYFYTFDSSCIVCLDGSCSSV